MSNHNFYDTLQPSEATARIVAGRNETMEQLESLWVNSGVENDVSLVGTFTSLRSGEFDRFLVVKSGGNDLTPTDTAQVAKLGCYVEQVRKRTAIVTKLHSAYDRRLLKVNMSTPQCCMFFFILALALALGVGALTM